ncbi:hypothetical protein VHEMI09323 [[Torrubiella] hemipterigena]|uniref:Hydrophobin n=1 Tax=[Torrubiella] hemipterigena TaxID=1531966 RepID=A0A0A1TQ58_9HYPO|nr:hypothetical protein VHEMI09323 [[Torrubiella] hemipterigena]
MKFFAVAALISAVAAATVPVQARGDYGGDDNDNGRDYNACPGTLYSSPVCGGVDILSLACLDVSTVQETPRNAKHFRDLCAKKGQQALCATLPILGQGLLCKKATGTERK